MLSLADFINKYSGQVMGNTSENTGQCVGVVSVWMDNLGLPHEWGDAKDLLANADTNFFDVIYNDPNNYAQFPSPGNIIVWGASWGGGHGHTGVIQSANGSSFVCFEQNDPEGSVAHLKTYNDYSGVLGWLNLKDLSKLTTSPTQQELDQLRSDRDKNWNLYQTDEATIQQLKTVIDNLNQQINDRNNQITTLNGQISTLNTQVTALTDQTNILKAQAIKVPSLVEQLTQSQSDLTIARQSNETAQRTISQLRSTSLIGASNSDLAKEITRRILPWL